MSIEQAKDQVAKIQNSAQTNERWKHEEQVINITESQMESTNRIFATLEVIFSGWRASMKSDEQISNMKRLWAEEIIKTKVKTGDWPNIEKGIEIAKQSESSFFPTIGKFLGWCCQDDSEIGENAMLRRFNNGQDPLTYIEQVTRSRCGYRAKRMPQEKGDQLFLKTFREVKSSTTIKDRSLMLDHRSVQKTIFTRKENQSDINNAGISQIKKLFNKHNDLQVDL